MTVEQNSSPEKRPLNPGDPMTRERNLALRAEGIRAVKAAMAEVGLKEGGIISPKDFQEKPKLKEKLIAAIKNIAPKFPFKVLDLDLILQAISEAERRY